MGKLSSIVVIVLAFSGAQSFCEPPDRKAELKNRRMPPMHQHSPTLEGRITDENGKPVRGVKVIFYGGMATRWKIADAETDAEGRYRYKSVRSSMIGNLEENRWDYYVGVRFEHPTHVEADGHSWRDVRVKNLPDHVETLDLKFTPGGHIEGQLKDAKTGEPLKKLDLKIETPARNGTRGAKFYWYATTDDRGHFRSISLFPGKYDVIVNSTTMNYPVLGLVNVEAGQVASVNFTPSLPRVIVGRVEGADGKPLGEVEVTLLEPKDSRAEVGSEADFMKFRTRAWTIFRPSWQKQFELALLPGLEQSRIVLAVHKDLGWAKVSVESLEHGDPIRLQPWKP